MRVAPKYLYQWDRNQRVVLDGVAAGTEVHYSCSGFDGGPVLVAYDEGGIIYADVPNLFLTSAGTIRVWLHMDDGNRGTTVFSASITVRPKAKPDDYVYTQTEIRTWESLAAQIAAIVDKITPNPEFEGLLYFDKGTATSLRVGAGLQIANGALSIAVALPDNPESAILMGLDDSGIMHVYKNGIEVYAEIDDDGIVSWPGISLRLDADGTLVFEEE